MAITDIVQQLEIERIFSTDGQFTKKDHSAVNPLPIPHGLLIISEYQETLDAHAIHLAKEVIKKSRANAGEIIGTIQSSNVYAIQLYMI